MDGEQARALAEEALDQWVRTTFDVVIDGEREETDLHWVFFFSTRAYVEAREPGVAQTGNGMVLVRKADGAIRFASSDQPGRHVEFG